MSTDERISMKRAALIETFKEIPEDQYKVAEDLISQAAFMAVLLEDLKEDINRNGFVEEYINGEHQSGRKQSTAAKTYISIIGKYAAIIDKLLKLVPKDAPTDAPVREPVGPDERQLETLRENQRKETLFLEALDKGEVTQDQYGSFMQSLTKGA